MRKDNEEYVESSDDDEEYDNKCLEHITNVRSAVIDTVNAHRRGKK